MAESQAEKGDVAVVQTRPCFWLLCTDCGDDCWEEGIPHFDSEAELWKQLLDDDGYGWTRDEHGRPLCRRCTERADCARDGHRHGSWQERVNDPGILYRWCHHCGSGFEEHLLALGDPRDVSTPPAPAVDGDPA